MAEIFTVEQRGIGKPDYSKEVSSARQRAGLSLAYLESLAGLAYVPTDQVAHPYAITWVKPVLAAGASAHLVDAATGVDTPYTLPAGYTLTIVQEGYTHNQDIELWVWMDTLLFGCYSMGPAGRLDMIELAVPFSTAIRDPTGEDSHTMDFIVTNVGGGNLEGAFNIVVLLEAVGTSALPSIKQCKCPFCDHIQVVPVGTTRIICEECRKVYIVQDYSRIRKF